MRVLLNATDGPLSVRAIRRYVTEMITGLGAEDSGIELHLALFSHRLDLVRKYLRAIPPGTQYKLHLFPAPRRMLSQRYRRSRIELRRLARKVDLYHETTVDSPQFDDLPVVATLHGLCPLVTPHLLNPDFVEEMTLAYQRTVSKSEYFVPVSETSRREFLERFPVAPESVRAIPLGISSVFHPREPKEVAETLNDLKIDREYVLYVGGIQRNKNIPRVLQTFSHLVHQAGFEGQLVLAGDLHYSIAEWGSLLDQHRIADRVVRAGFLDPNSPILAQLYSGAALFLFPSYYEGWTSPPLEAMACGVPVLASDSSSIPETVGDAAVLHHPDDEEAWCVSAEKLIFDTAFAETMKCAGFQRAAQFPWKKTVESTIEFYRQIVGGKPNHDEDLVASSAALSSTS